MLLVGQQWKCSLAITNEDQEASGKSVTSSCSAEEDMVNVCLFISMAR